MGNSILRKRVLAAACVLGMATAVAACGDSDDGGSASGEPAKTDVEGLGGQEAADEFNALYDAAVEAGKTDLVVYNAKDYGPVWDAFNARYPKIKIQQVPASGGDLVARLQAEFTSGKIVGDIANAGPKSAWDNIQNGWFEAYDPIGADKILPQYLVEGGAALVTALGPVGFEYNTDKVSEADVPKSWAELLKWSKKGDIATNNPTTGGTANGTFSTLVWNKAITLDDIKTYAELDPKIEKEIAQASTAVASGVVTLSAPQQFDYFHHDLEKGAHLGFLFPLETYNYLIPQYTGILKGAPHPDAAKLMVSWLLSPEGSAALAEIGIYAPISGGTPPEGMPPLEEIDQVDPVPFTTEAQEGFEQVRKDVVAVFKDALG